MQSVIGALRVTLGLDSAQFQRGMAQAQKDLQRARTQFLAVAGAVGAARVALAAITRQAMNTIDAQAKLARAVGGTTAGLQSLARAGDRAGVQQSELAAAATRLNQRLGQAMIAGKGAEGVFAKLGLTAEQLAQMDVDQRFAAISDAMKAAGMNTQEMSAYLRDLGIRQSSVITLIQGGSEEIARSRRAIEDFGVAVSEVDAASIERANDAMSEVGRVFEGIANQLAVAVAPRLERMANAFTESARAGGLVNTVIRTMIDNMDRFSVYMGVVVSLVGVRYVTALAAARLATLRKTAATAGLSTALFVLRGAIMRTGIGVLVIGAGELVLWLGRVIERVGGVGNAFKLVALNVKAASLDMQAFFLRAVGRMAYAFTELTWAIAEGLNNLFGSNLTGASGEITQGLNRTLIGVQGQSAAARKEIAALRASIAEAGEVSDDTSESIAAINDELEEVSGGSGGRSSGAGARAAKAIDDVAESLKEIPPIVGEIEGAFTDWLYRGLRDVRGFGANVIDSFRRMLAQMTAMTIANPIKIALGFGGSVAGTAAQAGSGLLGAAGMLGGLGAFAGGIGSGLGVVGSGFMAGGLSGGLTAMMGGITGGIGAGGAIGFGTALGAAIPVIGAAALVFGALRKTTKELDSGLNVTVTGMDVAARTFRQTQTSRYFGLSKSTNTSSGRADPAIATAINDVQSAVMSAARVLGVGSTAFEGFTARFNLSLKGMSAEQQMERINAQIATMGDRFASLVPGFQNANDLLARAAQISANIRALSDTSGLFTSRVDAVFAASSAGGRLPGVQSVDLLREIVRAIREGDINNARLTAQLVALQQRQELNPS